MMLWRSEDQKPTYIAVTRSADGSSNRQAEEGGREEFRRSVYDNTNLRPPPPQGLRRLYAYDMIYM